MKATFISVSLCLSACLLFGCPHEPPASTSPTSPAASLEPSASIPNGDPLLVYGKLRLGMSNFELAQAYNAPAGKGAGFTRKIQDTGDVQTHSITFTTPPGQPQRKLVAQVYRDQLDWLVDRRDGLTDAQAKAWLAELKAKYGKPHEVLPGAQWSWGQRGGVLLTYTQDNASADNMSANVVLIHDPTHDAAQAYLRKWEQQHPKEAQALGQ